jgi:hypothetical protein
VVLIPARPEPGRCQWPHRSRRLEGRVVRDVEPPVGRETDAWLSARTRSTMARRSAISRELGRWASTRPFRSQSLEVTGPSDHELKRFLHERSEEVMARAQLRSELPGRVHGGIDLAAEGRLHAGERRNDLTERDSASHEQVHVARSSKSPARGRLPGRRPLTSPSSEVSGVRSRGRTHPVRNLLRRKARREPR